MILIWIIMAIACAFPITIITLWHCKTLKQYWQLIGLVDLWILILWALGDSIARKFGLWHINFDTFSATVILGSQIGNAFWFLVVSSILSMITIIMWQADQKKVRFRDLFFKKE